MLKRLIILISLLAVLLLLVQFSGSKPTGGLPAERDKSDSTQYITKEYTITEIEGETYFGKAKDGTGISFNGGVIESGDAVKKDDPVICYFEKNNAGRGIVKVERKN
ncbi:hypothetical protein [Mesobacillus zeae]|uniref:Uncharacterized protein n=1 Tax=Mesobacillus zeae TaxID=1917180 RepID=A0A398BA48_9BACI|nr:hypothetical protein [Mesobacillus zeae]RID85718.1 hypothetical protein D1970_09225 [Mesobacillus zeae]